MNVFRSELFNMSLSIPFNRQSLIIRDHSKKKYIVYAQFVILWFIMDMKNKSSPLRLEDPTSYIMINHSIFNSKKYKANRHSFLSFVAHRCIRMFEISSYILYPLNTTVFGTDIQWANKQQIYKNTENGNKLEALFITGAPASFVSCDFLVNQMCL